MNIDQLKKGLEDLGEVRLQSAFPCGCWLYENSCRRLHTVFTPIELQDELESFLRVRISEIAKESLTLEADYSENLGDTIAFYALPIIDRGSPDDLALCTCLYSRELADPFALGRQALNAASLIEELYQTSRSGEAESSPSETPDSEQTEEPCCPTSVEFQHGSFISAVATS